MDQVRTLHPLALYWLNKSELARFPTPYLDYLCERCYRPHTAHAYLRCVAHFARWLTQSRLSLDRVNAQSVQRFLEEHLPRCHCPIPAHRRRHEVRAALKHLLCVLAMHGITEAARQITPLEEELC